MANGTITQLRRGVLGPCVLALLARRPRYGLELARELEAAGELLTSQGTLYPLLGRLHDAGLVTSRWELGDTDRPRRYYEISAAGRRELAEFQREWAAFAGAVTAVAGPPSEGES
ncbi:PadR family transcriptional regulator [Pseudolysinimonas sp.]|uniref:PadR family transcriptional regulator n=1 Tax=Pseudolysinimonas sp. TaxID=2680009 RepID=UPI003F7D63B7